MNRWGERSAAILLAAVMILILTACSSKGGAVRKINWVTAPAYASEDIALPVQTGDLLGSCTDGEYMYILADTKEGEEVSTHLLRVSLAEGTVEELEEFEASSMLEYTFVNRLGPILAPDGTLWLYEMWDILHYDLPEDFDEDAESRGKYLNYRDQFHHLRQLDPATGREMALVDLSDAVRTLTVENSFDQVDVAVDGSGNLYFAWNNGVAVLDKEGTCQFILEADLPASVFGSAGGRLTLLPDGTVAVLTAQSKRREVRTIDPVAQDWGGAVYLIPGDVGSIISGREPCLFYYIWDNVLYGVVEGDELPQRLLSLDDTRLESISGMDCFALLDGGRLAVLTRQFTGSDWAGESRIRLALLSPTDQLPEDGKVKVVYGTIIENRDIQNQINAFNRRNNKYYIEYRDYTEGAIYTADTLEEMNAVWDAARLRLAGEIAAGRAPDIMDDSLPLDTYARAGYLEDLWPWIDDDPEITREGLMSHVLDCASVDGRLYQVSGSFRIETAVASRAIAGSQTGWTLEEMRSAFGGTMPTIYAGNSIMLYKCNAERILEILLSMDMDRYVDWETGECRFEGEAFRDVLRLCASMGSAEMTYEPATPPLWEGGPVLCQVTMTGIEDLTFWDVYCGGPDRLSAETYEAALWDAGVLYTFVSPYNGQEVTNYENADFVGRMEAIMEGRFGDRIAADAVYGLPDGELYASFAGVPAAGGAGSSFTLLDSVAVSASSQAKEGAWAFVRSLLLPGGHLYRDSVGGMETSSSYGFPMNRADFEALLEPRWCRVDGDGELILDKDGQPIEAAGKFPITIGRPLVMAAYRMAPNQAQLDRFWTLYNAIEHMSGGNEELIRIITEQAQPHFAGDKSLDETMELIQRRVTLYVNENR